MHLLHFSGRNITSTGKTMGDQIKNKAELDMRLIRAVRAHPLLYNRKLLDYRFNDKKEAAWHEISIFLMKNSLFAKKKIQFL